MGAKSVYTYFGNALQSGLLVVVRRGDPEAGYRAHSGEEEDEGEEDDRGLHCCGRAGQGTGLELGVGMVGCELGCWVDQGRSF